PSKCSDVSSVIPCFLQNQSINTPILPVCESREFSGGDTKLEAIADAQLLLGTGRLDEGMDHAGLGVAGLSSLERASKSDSSCISTSSATNEAAGLSLDVVVVHVVYSVEGVILDEPGAAEL
ncbi:hypothetical protein Tco_1035825, partial [Tanacetum coccineum]